MVGWAVGLVRAVLSASGGFAGYCRSALASAKRLRARDLEPARSALFPLPVHELGWLHWPSRTWPRQRQWQVTHATRALTLVAGLALSYEATGRPHVPAQGERLANAAQLRVVARLRAAAQSVLRAAHGSPLRSLGLGRGRIAAGWDSVDALASLVRQLDLTPSYGRRAELVGELSLSADSGAEPVDVARVDFPAVRPHLDLAPLLVDDDVRAGYVDPASLEFTDAEVDAEAPGSAPFAGKACDRIPAQELGRFLERLDGCGMLFAARDDGTPRCGFFCVRKKWSEEHGHWVLRLVLDRRPRNSLERHVHPSEDTVPHGVCFLDVVLGPGEQLRIWATDLPAYY